jgi:transposase
VTHARRQHPNARLTPRHRFNMVACVIDKGWSVESTADRFQVDAKTVRKWVARFRAEGAEGLQDRSSRPHRSPNRTVRSKRREVVRLRRKRRWGADHIAHHVGLSSSTVQQILRSEGLARLDHGDRATDTEPVRRYQRDHPGELVHVDVKKLGAIPPGGGWKAHGRGKAPSGVHAKVGYRYLHEAPRVW